MSTIARRTEPRARFTRRGPSLALGFRFRSHKADHCHRYRCDGLLAAVPLLLRSFELLPDAGDGSRLLRRVFLLDYQSLLLIRRRIDSRIRCYRPIDQRQRSGIRVCKPCIIRDVSNDLWVHEVVDEQVSVGNMWRVARNGQQSKPEQSSFIRNHIVNSNAIVGLSGAVACLNDIAVIAKRNTNVTVCQRLYVVRRVNGAYVGRYWPAPSRRRQDLAVSVRWDFGSGN